MAWGGERGVVVVDMMSRHVVCALPAAALYHGERARHDRQRSPSIDQVPHTHSLSLALSPTLSTL